MRIWIHNHKGNLVVLGHLSTDHFDINYLHRTGAVSVALPDPATYRPVAYSRVAPKDMVPHSCVLRMCDRFNPTRVNDAEVVSGAEALVNFHAFASYPAGRAIAEKKG